MKTFLLMVFVMQLSTICHAERYETGDKVMFALAKCKVMGVIDGINDTQIAVIKPVGLRGLLVGELTVSCRLLKKVELKAPKEVLAAIKKADDGPPALGFNDDVPSSSSRAYIGGTYSK